MAFTLSGSVITQSGTDTDHSGLIGLAGVTTQTNGRQRVYTIDAELVINGTLSTSASLVEKLVFVGARTVTINGTWNFGNLVTDSQTGAVSRGSGIKTASLSFSYATGSWNNARLTIQTSGKFVGKNADIDCNVSTIVLNGSATWDVTDCTTSWASGGAQFRIWGDTAVVKCDGWVADGISYQWFNHNGQTDLIGYLPINSEQGFTRGDSGIFIYRKLTDFGAPKITIGGSEQVIELQNSAYGTSIQTRSYSIYPTVGQVVASATFDAKVLDASGAPIENARVYTSSAVSTGSNFYASQGYDYNRRIVTIDSTGATGSPSTEQKIILGEFMVNATSSYQSLSKRNGRTDDIWEIFFLAYGYIFTSTTQDFRSKGKKSIRQGMLADSNVTLSESAAGALTSIGTLDNLYDAAKHWKTRAVQTQLEYPSISTQPVNASGTAQRLGNRNLVVDATAASVFAINTGTNTITIKSSELTAGVKFKSLETTGAITFVNGATSSGVAIEDANGVRVTIRKSGGGNFNIAARYGSGSTYTDLGYQADVSTITYTVPKGQPVEVVMWALGYVTYSRLISTVNGGVVFDAEMTLNESINTSLDVSPYLPSIALSLDTSGASPVFVITFNAPMTIAGIELGKAVIHRLVGQEIALKAGFPPGSTATIVINSDEITNQLPAARLALGAGLLVTDRVYLDFFINTAPALAINPAYVINPPRADGNQVVILRAKPALDASVMALAVRQEIERTGGMLDVKASQASVTALAAANQAEHDATQAAIAALPAPLTATQTRAQVDAALTAYDAAVPADLATLATAAQVTALGAPLQASSYTAPPSATSTAQAVRAELATELGRMDAAVSSRLASASYTAPTAPPTAAQNATAVRAELATELGRIDASVSSRLAASAYTAPTTPPTAAAIRAEIETAGGKLDKAMKAAQAAEDQTL